MKLTALTDSSFHKQFLWSMQRCLIALYPQANFFPNRSQSLRTPPLLYQLGLRYILGTSLSFQHSSRHLHQEYIPSQETTSFAHSQETTHFNRRFQQLSFLPSGPTPILVRSPSHHSCSSSSTEVLSPSAMRAGTDLLQTSVNVGILASSHESHIFLMASRMASHFQRFSIYFAQIHQRNHYLRQV